MLISTVFAIPIFDSSFSKTGSRRFLISFRYSCSPFMWDVCVNDFKSTIRMKVDNLNHENSKEKILLAISEYWKNENPYQHIVADKNLKDSQLGNFSKAIRKNIAKIISSAKEENRDILTKHGLLFIEEV